MFAWTIDLQNVQVFSEVTLALSVWLDSNGNH